MQFIEKNIYCGYLIKYYILSNGDKLLFFERFLLNTKIYLCLGQIFLVFVNRYYFTVVENEYITYITCSEVLEILMSYFRNSDSWVHV